jgi:transcriptional regulator with XRE-family HTH domain
MLDPMDATDVGRSLRAIRFHRRLTQAEVADRAGISQSVYSRAESGRLEGMTVGSLDRIATELGANLVVGLRYGGGLADRLVDAAHATLVEFVVGFLRDRGWQVELEFSFNVFGERGSVDVLGWHAPTRTLLIVEVKSRFTDLQAMLLSLSRKLRLVPTVARDEMGWDAASVGRVILAYGTAENRAVLDSHSSIFGAVFPARAQVVRRWLGDPSGPIAGVWLVSDGIVPFPGYRRPRRR